MDEHIHTPDVPLIGPQIPEPRLLSTVGWYDGLLSGIVEVDGEKLWAEMAQWCFNESCGWHRRFQVVRLAPEKLENQLTFLEDESCGEPICWFEQ